MNCEICGGSFIEYYKGEIRDGDNATGDSIVYQCDGCGVLRLRETDCLQEDAYASQAYRELLHQPDERRFELDDPYQIDRLKVIGTHNLRGKRVLDFGAGSGSFCDHIKGLAQVDAIEVNEKACDDLISRGVMCWRNLDYWKRPNWPGYDIITSLLVIEHLKEPFKIHKRLYEMLAPGGKLLIQTPRLPESRNLYSKFFRTQHRWYWNEESMAKFVIHLTDNPFELFYMHRSHMDETDIWASIYS